MNNSNFDKIIALLEDLYKSKNNRIDLKNLITHSNFDFTSEIFEYKGHSHYKLVIKTEPQIFLDFFDNIEKITETIKYDIEKISNLKIDNVEIKPDYNRFEIISSVIQPIYTEWEEINTIQGNLVSDLKNSRNDIDAQNIGNTCRTLIYKLSTLVFDESKHKINNEIDTSVSKYKNRLHCYIKSELSGKNNKELRQFSESAITTVEKTIDLTNNLTHNKNADGFLSEYCVIATISVISLVKLIKNLN